MTNTVNRTDYFDLVFRGEAEKLTKTAEGFMQGVACVTNIGIFPYMLPDGSIRNELRLPEEVFAEDSLATLKGKPLTDDHPDEAVNPDNVKELMVGALGTEPTTDDQCVYMPLTFHRRDALDNIQAGKRALSCGYTCELEFVSGTKWGMRYDAIQRKIRYNHVALVDKGRAGDDAVLRMDGAGWTASFNPSQHQDRSSTMKTIHLDNVAYQADEAVCAALSKANADALTARTELQTKVDAMTALQGRFDALTAEMATLKSDNATLKATADQATADKAKCMQEMEDVKKSIPGQCDSAVKARLQLQADAALAGVEFTAEMTNDAISKAILTKVAPDVKGDEDPAYLKARVDIALKSLRADTDPGRSGSVDVPTRNQDGAPAAGSLAETKAKHDKAIADAWKA